MTAYNVEASSLSQLNSQLKGIQTGNYCYVKNGLQLGDQKGNQFEIVIRNIKTTSSDEIESAVQSLKTTGFINYFGKQRFGTSFPSTFTIGISILKNDWESVIGLLLSPSSDPQSKENVFFKDAKNAFFEGNFKKAAQLFPKNAVAEHSILTHLMDQPKDYANAIARVVFCSC